MAADCVTMLGHHTADGDSRRYDFANFAPDDQSRLIEVKMRSDRGSPRAKCPVSSFLAPNRTGRKPLDQDAQARID